MAPQRLGNLVRDTRATVALETALLFPFLFMLMVGCWEAYAYMRAASIVDRVAITVGDMVARKSLLYDRVGASDSDNLGAYYEAAEQIAVPLDLAATGGLILSAVYNDGDHTEITWQRRAPYSGDDAVSRIGGQGEIPTMINSAGQTVTLRPDETVIVAEVFYRLQPFFWTSAVWEDAPLSVTLYHRAIFMSRYGGINELTP